ncbi:hypothetical protein [Clostridium scatologenes]|uniref:TIR domain-containing protein n=1 Tax=Clostridium scatologenes TaxID=1548 RepID=A0A0E3JZB1_CLOSL|nr:hypothetical protein [Clostridium scatologenes]AKA68114.1 hypothetical protein CSCA_0989 [Clostridium scatologenes]
MFVGFKLNIDENLFNDYDTCCYNTGNKSFNLDRKKFEKSLENFILKDGSLDGSNIQSDWFPQIDADIFISHWHKDKDMAIALSGWLNRNFQLNAFVDSCAWGYCENLLKEIDNKYCLIDGRYYDYTKRNYSTSHVHMMLCTALVKMMDKAECLFFLNTPNLIKTSYIIEKTQSPWIYMEIAAAKLIRKTPREIFASKQNFNFNVNYNLDMEHLYEINYQDLEKWRIRCFKYGKGLDKFQKLDELYKIKNII